MKIETFTIVAGSLACNARCPFCVAEMTPENGVETKLPAVNWRNFEVACRLAKQSGVTTVLITGKGEPTLFPSQITEYLHWLGKNRHSFPFVELQTNGYLLAGETLNRQTEIWNEHGLTTIALSIVHYKEDPNRQIYMPYRDRYYNLSDLIEKLHRTGFSIRLCCMMVKGIMDSSDSVENLIQFSIECGVEQLTIRPIVRPNDAIPEGREVADYVREHAPSSESIREVYGMVKSRGTLLMTLAYGAEVYDFEGQNVCLSNCLTGSPSVDEMRQLIFFPDGHLRYDWRYKGAILL